MLRQLAQDDTDLVAAVADAGRSQVPDMLALVLQQRLEHRRGWLRRSKGTVVAAVTAPPAARREGKELEAELSDRFGR